MIINPGKFHVDCSFFTIEIEVETLFANSKAELLDSVIDYVLIHTERGSYLSESEAREARKELLHSEGLNKQVETFFSKLESEL